jgi:UDP-glucose 4-epimerase
VKTIVVTGGAGFVGSQLCKRLTQEGYRVISLDNYFTGSKENHYPGVEYREGHTKDIATHITETPDILFHLGEYARVEQSLEEPARVWELNVAGTFGVLEFWRAKKCKLVYAGSSTKFGDGGLARVATPYAWTKAANTELVKNYASWYGLPFAITYFYNVYGPGERAGKYGTVVEIFRQKMQKGEPLTVEEPGTQVRNFTHIDDIIDGLVLIGEKGDGEEFGLGSPEAVSIIDLAKMFGGRVQMIPSRRGNRMESALDDTKSRAIGWAPKRTLTEYIASL